jgi:hypothetical protein
MPSEVAISSYIDLTAPKAHTREAPPEVAFDPQHYYTCEEIAASSAIPLDLVRAAAAAKEIAFSYVLRSESEKSYQGSSICGWIRRAGLKCMVTERTFRQWEVDQAAAVREVEQRKRRAEAERDAIQQMFRQAAADCSAVQVLRLLAHAEKMKLSMAGLLRLVENAGA